MDKAKIELIESLPPPTIVKGSDLFLVMQGSIDASSKTLAK